MSKFDKKDVYSWSNCEEARQYIGEEGYFRDDYQEDLAAWYRGSLQDVDQSMPVDCIFENEGNVVFGLSCLPIRLKEKFEEYEWLDSEDRWQPFGVEEKSKVYCDRAAC